MKKFFRFLISRLFLVNLLLAIVIVIVLVFGALQFLRIYTDHGESHTVPDLIGLKKAEVQDICNQQNMEFEITDSTFADDVPLGAIAEQYPRPGTKVKEGRTIYLVKNAEMPEMVVLPDILNISLRQARSTLEAYGFAIGKLEYIPDIGKNVVLRMKVRGEIVKAGKEIFKGDTIDLVLGQGLSDEKTYVPNVEGVALDAATNILNDKYLNVGAVMYDETVENEKDSVEAKIYKQYPAFDTINNVNMGTSVDLWLSTDSTKIPEFVPDSVLMDSVRLDSLKSHFENREENDEEIN
ncbi:MAG: PASTA domain-containing protein [Bacteroidota bacterium]